MASPETVMRVYRRNPDTIVAFARGGQVDEVEDDRPLGFLCHLPLNKDGFKALFDHRLNTLDPQDSFIARQNERPAAIYYWCIYMDEGVGGGMALAVERSVHKYGNLPAYCKAATEQARIFFLKMGFVENASDGTNHDKVMMQYLPPQDHREWPKYDNYMPGHYNKKRIGVTVARNAEDLAKAIAVRGAAYLEDRLLPLEEDHDGNDHSATHLIGYVGDEAAGCIRIRYFANFVKFERLAVVARHRRSRLAIHLVRAAIDFVQAKGYRHIYGQAAQHALPIWKYFKFEIRPGDGIEYLTDERYYEIDLHLSAPPLPITSYAGATVLVRQEGRWHRRGPLEQGQSWQMAG
jgi:GNAT superfamily N-acetyltransferase